MKLTLFLISASRQMDPAQAVALQVLQAQAALRVLQALPARALQAVRLRAAQVPAAAQALLAAAITVVVLTCIQIGPREIGPVVNQITLNPVIKWFIRTPCIARTGTPTPHQVAMRPGQAWVPVAEPALRAQVLHPALAALLQAALAAPAVLQVALAVQALQAPAARPPVPAVPLAWTTLS